MNQSSVLILGGGIGGVAAANALRKALPKKHRIVLVDREPSFTLAASFLWVMSGARTAAQVSRPLDNLRRKGIEVVHGEVEHLDPARREATVSGAKMTADQIVVALGAEFALDAIPGLAPAGHTFVRPVASLRQSLAVALARRRNAIEQMPHTRVLNRRREMNLFQPYGDDGRIAQPGLAQLSQLGELGQIKPAVTHQAPDDRPTPRGRVRRHRIERQNLFARLQERRAGSFRCCGGGCCQGPLNRRLERFRVGRLLHDDPAAQSTGIHGVLLGRQRRHDDRRHGTPTSAGKTHHGQRVAISETKIKNKDVKRLDPNQIDGRSTGVCSVDGKPETRKAGEPQLAHLLFVFQQQHIDR